MRELKTEQFVGRAMPRREDRRLLTGRGRYVADFVLPRTLHAVFVRSPVAHGRIRSVDLSLAAKVPGVIHVLTGAEIRAQLPRGPNQPAPMPAKWRELPDYLYTIQVAVDAATQELQFVSPPVVFEKLERVWGR